MAKRYPQRPKEQEPKEGVMRWEDLSPDQKAKVSRQWFDDQQDPNNFLDRIGSDTVFGKGAPILHPRCNFRGIREELRDLCKSLRLIVKAHFSDLGQVKAALLSVHVTDPLVQAPLSEIERTALTYQASMSMLHRVLAELDKSQVDSAMQKSLQIANLVAATLRKDVNTQNIHLKQLLSQRVETARNAANARHSKPGGSREKREAIRALWASGNYTSRDRCAEEECGALDMSFSAARNALKNQPKPDK